MGRHSERFDETEVVCETEIQGDLRHTGDDGVRDVALCCMQAAAPAMCSRLCVRAVLSP